MLYANLVLALVLAAGSRLRVLLVVVAEYLLLDGLWMTFAVYAKLPTRVVLPAYFSAAAAVFYVVLREASLRRHLLPLPPGTGCVR